MTARSFPLPDHQSHVISAAGPCYLGFSSTKVSTSEAFHLKSLIKQLTKPSRKKHRIPLNTAMSSLQPPDLGLQKKKKKKKRSLFIVVLLPLALQGGESLLSAEALHSQNPSPSFLLVTRLTLPQSCCSNEDCQEAGLSPRSMLTGDEARFLTRSFLLPFLGYQANPSSTPRPKETS